HQALAGQVTGLARRDPGPRRLRGLDDHGLGLARVALEPGPQVVVAYPLDERPGLGVAELGLGLALELRLGQLDVDDGRQALPDVVAGQPLFLLADQLLLAGIVVDDVGQRRPEALLVRAALGRVDRV